MVAVDDTTAAYMPTLWEIGADGVAVRVRCMAAGRSSPGPEARARVRSPAQAKRIQCAYDLLFGQGTRTGTGVWAQARSLPSAP
jgi:hypothetical protein